MPRSPQPLLKSLRPLLVRALSEDLGRGDITSRLLEMHGTAEARIVAQARGIACGLPFLSPLFALLDRRIAVRLLCRDGARVRPGQTLAVLAGHTPALLAGERTALNLLMHCSGIATLARRHVDAVRGLKVTILDTRKTLPGLRALEKYAVDVGGGTNHRMGLYDQVLIKNNHLACLGHGIAGAVALARERLSPRACVQVEARALREALAAAGAGADIILLDNFTVPALRAAVRAIRARFPRKPLLEASGGITLASLRTVALTGVDRISVGALTHSAPAFPMAMRLSPR